MATATETGRNGTHTAHLEAVTRAIDVMRHRLAHPQPLSTLAEAAAFSPFHFHEIFRELTAVTPARFLAALRMAEARRLLLHSSLPIRQVAAQVGYTSPGTFAAQFAQLTGTPPARFRGQARALGDVRAAEAARWSRLSGTHRGAAVTLARAPEPGSLVCICLVPSGSLRIHRGHWTAATGSSRVPGVAPVSAAAYATFCLVIPPGERVVDALIDEVPGSLRLGRVGPSPPGHPPPPGVRMRWPEPADPPITALLSLTRPAG
ncbi:helix-turn-helix domain-containing protein [Actinoplanes sp. NPDC051859]|uniref:helix-turn-helix domain-containing protein n=1 Tax=Actinoplanes sp. NPDC051859 TaxID=3363909 RepID=UPI0037BAECE0